MDPRIYVNNPLRPLDWRAVRARELLRYSPAPRDYDDALVRGYSSYLRDLKAASDDASRQEQAGRLRPHIALAHKLRYDTNCHPRHMLEGSLLTRESLATIATKRGLDEHTVDAYEKLFFQVRDRLDAQFWVAQVINSAAARCSSPSTDRLRDEEQAYIYHCAGYYGGPLVLESVISAVGPGGALAAAGEAANWQGGTLAAQIRTWALALVATRELRQSDALALMKLAWRLQATAASAKARHSAEPPIAWDEILAAVNTSCGGPPNRAAAEGESSHADPK